MSAIYIKAENNIVPIEIFCIDESFVKDDITTEDLFDKYVKWHLSILDRLGLSHSKYLCNLEHSECISCFEPRNVIIKNTNSL